MPWAMKVEVCNEVGNEVWSEELVEVSDEVGVCNKWKSQWHRWISGSKRSKFW